MTKSLIQNRISLFSSKLEFLNLIFPIFSVIVFIFFLLSDFDLSFPKVTTQMYFWGAFLGDGHTCFTFLFLLMTTEGKNLTKQLFFKHQLRFLIALTLLVIICVYLVLKKINYEETLAMKLIEGCLLLLFSQHALGQIRGISLLYNKELKKISLLSSIENLKINSLEAIEKYLHLSLLITWLIQVVVLTFFENKFAAELSIIQLLIIISIFVLSFLYPYSINSNKSFFLLRLFIFPIIIFYPILGFSVFIFHGLEYVLILFKLIGNSRNKFSAHRLLILITILFFIFPLLHYLQNTDYSVPSILLLTIIAITRGTDFFHYYIDSLIFRFNDPAVQTNMGPLIK